MTQPVEFLKETIPSLFNDVFDEVRAQAAAGDAEAKQKVEDLPKAAPLAVRVVLEGKGKKDLYVVFENGQVRTVESAPSVPVLFAVAVDNEAFEIALDDMSEELERGLAKLRKKLPLASPLRARAGIEHAAGEKMLFHYVVKDTPDFDEVRVKIGIGASEPPEKPTFTVTIQHEIIEQLREKKLKPQNLLSKVQLTGDASRAMQLAMQFMQKRAG